MEIVSEICARTGRLAVVLSLFAVVGEAQTLRTQAYRDDGIEGTRLLYRLDHDGALESFASLIEQYPEHPGPPLSKAVTLWLRELFMREDLDLERFISPGHFTRPGEREMPEAARTEFFELVEQSQRTVSRYLKNDPDDVEALYYLGASHAALGVFAFTIDRGFREALEHGKEAYRIQRAVVAAEPEFDDAYMTLGTYEYVVANLPWYIKWIATLAGYRGSERRGFEYVSRAATEGFLVTDDARVLLMVMYVREERYGFALEMAGQLHQRYPENFLLHLNQAQILERMGETGKAAATYAAVAKRAQSGFPNYQKLPLDRMRYPLAERMLALGDEAQALDAFRNATNDPETPARERALSHLRAGQILDTLGRREEAVKHYQRVHELQEFDGSHGTADGLLKEPYQPER